MELTLDDIRTKAETVAKRCDDLGNQHKFGGLPKGAQRHWDEAKAIRTLIVLSKKHSWFKEYERERKAKMQALSRVSALEKENAALRSKISKMQTDRESNVRSPLVIGRRPR